MKKLIFIFILLYSLNISAQKGIVYYGYINSMGIGDVEGNDLNSYMIFNKNQSYYVSAKDSLEKAGANEGQKVSYKKNGQGVIQNGLGLSSTGNQVVYNIKNKTMWSNFLLGSQIYVKETVPVLNWKIEKESKKVGKFNCTKASCLFRGRKFTAWFSTEIPLQFGPWKLNGLPGLILEAYDTDKSVFWYFKKLTYPTNIKDEVKYMSIPKNQNFKSYDEFKKFQQEKIDALSDKQKIISKSYPDVKLSMPKKSEMFIECE